VVPEQSSRGERGLRKDAEPRSIRGGARDPSPLPRHSSVRQPLPRSAAGLPALGNRFWSIVEEGLSQLGVELSGGARSAIDVQARLLLAWNSAINLTALRSEQQIARDHVLDSLAAVPLIRRLAGPRLAGLRLLDLGSGAGYPGLPLAVTLPVARCALVDSVRKKQSFLQVAAESAVEAMAGDGQPRPEIVALAERAEDLADEPDQRAGWDFVVARAVGTLAEIVELSLPLLAVGGHLIAWKRAQPDGSLKAELGVAQRIIGAVGGGRPTTEAPVAVAAVGLEHHVLIHVCKVRPTPQRYPRQPAERRRALLR
jgi:16S rRNA (guanine527-N7)-methyltransferase